MTSNPQLRLTLAKLLWGWTPHPTQHRWFLCDARTKVAACGRRWGKTEAAAVDAATMALTCPGSRQMIVSPSYDQSRLIFDSVERLMQSNALTKQRTKVLRTPYPKLTIFGSTITARTADEDGRNLRGNSADRVIVDEAAYVRDSVIYEVISPMLADINGRLVMISTPFGKNHFYKAFMRGTEGCGDSKADCSAFTFPSWENPHISREYIEEQRNVISPRQFSVEYEARFIDDKNTVFAWEDIEAALQNTEERGGAFETVVAGIDWARYSDYTALAAVGVSESGLRVIGIERFNGLGWDSQINRAVDFLQRHGVSTVLADQTSIGDPLLEQLRNRLCENGMDVRSEGLLFTNKSKREIVENLSVLLSRREIIIPDNEQLLRELQYFEYELTQSGNIRMNARSGYHDDLVIALALACKEAKNTCAGGSYLAGNERVSVIGW